jgi:hypothetical protein
VRFGGFERREIDIDHHSYIPAPFT